MQTGLNVWGVLLFQVQHTHCEKEILQVLLDQAKLTVDWKLGHTMTQPGDKICESAITEHYIHSSYT